MKLNTLFLAWAVVGAVFGLGFLLVPATVLGLYSTAVPPLQELELASLLGASYLGYAVLVWGARSITDPAARKNIVLANLVVTVLSVLLFLKGILIDGFNTPPEWFNVVLIALFAAGFAYFYFTKQD